jgi:hypothetical protein
MIKYRIYLKSIRGNLPLSEEQIIKFFTDEFEYGTQIHSVDEDRLGFFAIVSIDRKVPEGVLKVMNNGQIEVVSVKRI